MQSGRLRSRSLMRVAVEDISRFTHITRMLVKYGFAPFGARAGLDAAAEGEDSREAAFDDVGETVDPASDPLDTARRFREMLEELGPTFVKVGQILSTRADLLPPPFVEELARLQDEAPQLSAEEVRTAIEEGLGGRVEDHFASFEWTALASASIAETHVATLPDGKEVVVKVQRPGIAETIRSDLDLLFLFAKVLEWTIAEMETYAPGDIVRALDEALSMELDFTIEAENLERFAQNFRDDPDIFIPALHPSHTSRTVLTMERVVGRKISELPDIADGPHYARLLLEALYRMVFEHGLFHADPHPGNCLIAEDGRLALIDFGLCGYLSQVQQDHMINLIVSVIAGDVDGIARMFLRMGRPLGHIQITEFKAEISAVRDRYLGRTLRNIDVSRFSMEAMDAAQRFRVRMAPEYALLVKCGVTIEGIIRRLDPDYDILKAGQVYSRRMLARRYSRPRLQQDALSGFMSLSHFLREVPDQLTQILMDAESGTLQIKLQSRELERLESQMNTQTTRVFLGFCCAGLTVATPLFLAVEPLWWGPIPVATATCGITATVVCWLGLGWHLLGGPFGKLRLRPFLRFLRGRS